jgi:hypothetical protein
MVAFAKSKLSKVCNTKVAFIHFLKYFNFQPLYQNKTFTKDLEV